MATIENELVFRRAVRYGFRTHDITACTRIAPKRVRNEFRAVHGSNDPPTGKKPSNPDVIFGSPETHRQASLYFSFLRAVRLVAAKSDTTPTIEMVNSRGMDACIDALFLYHQLYADGDRFIDPTKAFAFVRKFFHAQHLDLVTCRDCGSPYVVQAAVPGMHPCPFCEERRTLLSQCRYCRSPLLEDSGRCSDLECRRRNYARHRYAPAVYHCSALGS